MWLLAIPAVLVTAGLVALDALAARTETAAQAALDMANDVLSIRLPKEVQR